MKIALFVVLFSTLLIHTTGLYAQNMHFTLTKENTKMVEILGLIESQSGYYFLYNGKLVDVKQRVSIQVEDQTLEKTLDALFQNTNINYKVYDRQIVLSPDERVESGKQQEHQSISGKVFDSAGFPLSGVTIMVKGTILASISNGSGNYSLQNTMNDAILVFSYVGMKTIEIPTSGKLTVNVKMEEETVSIDEVVAIGYGIQQKKDIIGSVSVVDMQSVKTIPTSSADQALQGQAAGVDVVTSGVPGGIANIYIRGISSFGNTQPLVIIDGVQSSLHDINTNDIESIQVLKDAGSASIYGVRGSNGVILVTTKKGKSGEPKFTYTSYFGLQTPASGNVFNSMNTSEYADLAMKMNPGGTLFANGIPDYLYSGYVNGVQISGTAKEGDPAVDPSKYVYNPGDPTKDYIIQKVNKNGTDWFHEIFKNAPVKSHTLTASGGTNSANYLFSLSSLDQEGTLIQTSIKRYSIRVNTNYEINKHFRIGENLYAFYKQNPNFSFANQNQDNAISQAERTMVLIPANDIKGNYGGTWAGPELIGRNPAALMKSTDLNKGNTTDLNGNAFAEFDFLKHFTFRTNFGGTLDNQYYLFHAYNIYQEKENHNSVNTLNETTQVNTSWTWSNTLTFSNTIGKHRIKVVAGSEANSNSGRVVGGGSTNFLVDSPDYLVLGNGSSNVTNFSSGYIENLYSLFSRMDYSFDDQYLFGATIRRDGSSKFGSENRFGIFPSVSTGWRISKASFLKNISWLDDLKIRGSWGKLGSQNNVGVNNVFTLYNSGFGSSYYDIDGSGNLARGFYASSFGNNKTGWEEDIITNVGLDATVLQNRLNFSVEWYKKSINGLLFPKPLPATAGGSSAPIINIGDIENTGLDYTIGYHVDAIDHMSYNASINITTYKSNVKQLPNPGYFDSGGASFGTPIVRNQVGHSVSAFYGYEVERLFQDETDVLNSATQDAAAPGRFKYRDINHDGVINNNDRTFIGNPNPKFTYGINLGVTYRQLDLSMNLYGSQGNDVFNYTRYFSDFWSTPSGNKSKDMLNAWTPQNKNSTVPVAEPSSNFSTSDVANSYYIENGSFLKCRLVTFGYKLTPTFLSKIGGNSLRIYIQGMNLFTITHYSGLDPELMSNQIGSSAAFGIDYGNYPSNEKSYLCGVQLTF